MSNRQDDAPQIHPRDVSDRYNVRRKHERHVYVIEFASGTVKVGQAMILKDRLNAHVRTALAHGDAVTRTWGSAVHIGYGDNEQALIAFCAERWEPAIGVEYYRDADFDAVVEYAQGLPYKRMPDAEVAAIMANSGNLARAFQYERDSNKALADLLAAAQQAEDQIELVVSLITDDNRWAASDAIFGILKKLYAAVASPWSEADPTAAERYLVTCGATPERAQDNAAEFELGMRALYVMATGVEAKSFEDIARFSTNWTSGGAE